jgi:type I restriction enzyme S subunit
MSRTVEKRILADVLEITSGQVDPTVPPYAEMPHVGGDNIESGSGRIFGVRTAAELRLISGKYLFHAGEILYSKIRPALNKATIPDFDGICSADIYPLRVNPKIAEPRYLIHVLRSRDFLAYTEQHASRTNIPKVNRDALLGYEAALPPLSEQRRIADILDKADAIRRKRQRTAELLGEMQSGLFESLFGRLFDSDAIPGYVAVSHFVERFQGGLNVATPDSPTPRTRYFILKVSAVTWGEYQPNECKPLPEDYEPPEEDFVRANDLLFSRANTSELIGATVFVHDTPPDRVLPDKLWRYVWRAPDAVEPLFVCALMNHPKIRYEIGRRATGTSGSMKNISMDKVLSLPVPWPPLELQCRFAAEVRQIRTLTMKSRDSLVESENLFHSLVQRAFRGEL